MKRPLSTAALACFLLFSAIPLFAQLQEPVQPVNLIIDSDMESEVDDVGDHAAMWALSSRGEVSVLALISSSANDYTAPSMRPIAN